MLARTLAFAAGVYVLFQFSSLPSLFYLLSLFPLIVICFCLKQLNVIGMFLIGFSWSLFIANYSLSTSLPAKLEQKTIRVEGIVVSLPEDYSRHKRFRFEIQHYIDEFGMKRQLTLLVRLSWYESRTNIKPGQRWQFNVKLKRPYGFMNPGGFDYELWLLRQGIRATGYIKDNKTAILLGSSGHYIEQLRARLALAIQQHKAISHHGLILALSLGERYLMIQDETRLLMHTGTSHLIAISGLHLGLVAGMVFLLAQFIWRQFHFLTGICSSRVVGSIAAFIAAVCYALLAGFTLPTQRALIMIGVFLIAIAVSRPIKPINALSLAALLVLVVDPFAILATDFWLSFSAVCFIFYVCVYRSHYKVNRIYSAMIVQGTLSLALIPLLIIWFNQFPLYSVLANAIAIPLIGLVIVPLCLLATLSIVFTPAVSGLLFQLIDKLAALYWQLLDIISSLPMTNVTIATPDKLSFILAIIGILILLMPRGLPARHLGVVFLLPIFFPLLSRPDKDEFQMTLLDVGQGLAIVIQTHSHALLYDTGAKFSPRFNTGDAVVLPYLRHSGIDELASLIISHGDNDHIGGADAVLRQIEVRQILTSAPEKLPLHKTQRCISGQQWQWDGVKFDILHPSTLMDKGNNGSCVLKVSSRYGSILLTGDIEKRVEQALVETRADALSANVLIVPHHGSRTSSSGAFIDAVSPEYAFIAAGYKNRFGFPKQDILTRYNIRGIDTRTSYQSGAITLLFSKNGMLLSEARQQQRSFWHETYQY